MKKQVFGRRFKRDKNQRKALFNGLVSSMLFNEGIKTTEQKAKSVKADVEKLVTKAKKGNKIFDNLNQTEIDRLIINIAPRFTNRNGGYTRIVRIGRRFQDNATMVLLQWVDGPVSMPKTEKKVEKPKKVEKKASPKKAEPKKKAVKKESK